MPRTAFFLRAYNDLDHLAPLVWRFAADGLRPVVIVTTSLAYEDDYRMQHVRAAGDVEIHRIFDRDYERFQRPPKSPWRRLQRKLYTTRRNPESALGRWHRRAFDCSEEIRFLREGDIGRCVFEWGTPYARGEVIERFFMAARGMGLPTFCLPHGCNIYIDADVNEGYRAAARRGRIPNSAHRNLYDYYVFQNPIRRDLMVRWGYDPLRTQAWGSVRFDPSWQRRNLEICPPFRPTRDPEDRIRVVFMHHQKNYNLHADRIWRLLERLAGDARFQLVLKSSTRGGTDYPSRSFYGRYGDAANVETVTSEVHSPALVDWAHCVINFGSSIGLEVLLQQKPLIVPTHLHSNRTLFERFGAGTIVASDDAVIEAVAGHHEARAAPDGVKAIFREVIYGGRDPHDVIESYRNRICANQLSY